MRARTRDMFKRGFKTKGMIPLTTFLRVYKVGDIVDIKANAAQQKGMPHKYYHGYVRPSFKRVLGRSRSGGPRGTVWRRRPGLGPEGFVRSVEDEAGPSIEGEAGPGGSDDITPLGNCCPGVARQPSLGRFFGRP